VTPLDAFKAAVRAVIGYRLDYSALYPATVVAHGGGPTLQVLPDSDRIKGLGLGNVPLRYGLPGATAVLPPGTRCLVGFASQDPKQPYVSLWDEGGAPLTVVIAAATSIGLAAPVVTAGDGSGGYVALADKVDAFIQAFDTVMRTSWIVAPTDGGAALRAAYLAAFSTPPEQTDSGNLKAE